MSQERTTITNISTKRQQESLTKKNANVTRIQLSLDNSKTKNLFYPKINDDNKILTKNGFMWREQKNSIYKKFLNN